MNTPVPDTTPHHTVVTSFAKSDWPGYPKRFFETWDQHWPGPTEVRQVVVHEFGQNAEDWPTDLPNCHLVPIEDIDGLPEFLAAIQYFPLFCGMVNNQYTITYDAQMARKTFIEAWACEKYGGKVFWIDADVITHEDVTTAWLDEVLPDDMLACHLGREKMYTESGFIGYNTNHELCTKFMENYRSLFTTGTFITLPAWHDCVAFDAAREAFEQYLPGQFNNLGEGVDPGKGLHVFINSVLGAKMDHLKGNRKKLPRSPKADLTIERHEAHWK